MQSQGGCHFLQFSVFVENVFRVCYICLRLVLLFQEVKANPSNYDAWFDYLRLMESESDELDVVRDVYERAIANIPPLEVRFYSYFVYSR